MNQKIVLFFLCFATGLLAVLTYTAIITMGAPAYAFLAGAFGFVSVPVIKYVYSYIVGYNTRNEEIDKKFREIEKQQEANRRELERQVDVRLDLTESKLAENKAIATQSKDATEKLEKELNELRAEAYSGVADAQRSLKMVDTALNFTRAVQDKIEKNSDNLARLDKKIYLLTYKLGLIKKSQP